MRAVSLIRALSMRKLDSLLTAGPAAGTCRPVTSQIMMRTASG